MLVQTGEGWIVELQLIPEAMHKLKSTLGHNDYVQYRFIIEAGHRARASTITTNSIPNGGSSEDELYEESGI